MNPNLEGALVEGAALAQPDRAEADTALRLNAELIRTLYRQTPAIMAASAVNAVLVAFVVWDSVPHPPLIAWVAVLLGISLARTLVWLRHWRGKTVADATALRWGWMMTLTLAAGGLVWGLGSVMVIVLSDSLTHQIFIAFVIGGMGAGAMAGMTCFMPAFYGSVPAMLLPCAAAYFAYGQQPYLTMGAMISVFLAAVLYIGHTIHGTIAKSVRLSFVNEGLIETLARGRAAADGLVVERTQALLRLNQELEQRVRDQAAAERALRQSERQLLLITDNLPALIAFIDRELRYRFVNACYERWFHLTRADFIGTAVREVMGEALFARVEPKLKRALGGELVVFEDERPTKIGPRKMRLMFVPYRGEGGTVEGIIVLAQDRTEELLAESALRGSEERLRGVIQNMPVMMFALDEIGGTIVWNRECERITGYGADEIVGNPKALEVLFPDPTYRELVRATMLEPGGYRDSEWQITCKGGGVRTISWFNISGSYPVPGWASWAMGFDVSDRIHARTELEQALSKERELGELKSRFVAMASHEFRTPLTTIQASADLLRHYGDRLDETQKADNLREIAREVGNLTNLLNEILTIGRAEAGKLEFKPALLDLEALCRDLVAQTRLEARPDHEFLYECRGGCTEIALDEQLVRHMVSNMLSNAVKYSPKGGPIRLTVACTADTVSIAVADQGIGIPAAGREHLFEAFHRFCNVGAISGSGLGLVILKRAAERHGGTVTCESEEGVGTAFRVTLPCEPRTV